MPEHMKRRQAVYYFRRVVPKDLQAAGEPREVCRSLKTRDFSEAKRRLHIESVRFDEWVGARPRLAGRQSRCWREAFADRQGSYPTRAQPDQTGASDNPARNLSRTVAEPQSVQGCHSPLGAVARRTIIAAEQKIDRLAYELYGLSADDVREVEDWAGHLQLKLQ
jgi:hypothetical protein